MLLELIDRLLIVPARILGFVLELNWYVFVWLMRVGTRFGALSIGFALVPAAWAFTIFVWPPVMRTLEIGSDFAPMMLEADRARLKPILLDGSDKARFIGTIPNTRLNERLLVKAYFAKDHPLHGFIHNEENLGNLDIETACGFRAVVRYAEGQNVKLHGRSTDKDAKDLANILPSPGQQLVQNEDVLTTALDVSYKGECGRNLRNAAGRYESLGDLLDKIEFSVSPQYSFYRISKKKNSRDRPADQFAKCLKQLEDHNFQHWFLNPHGIVLDLPQNVITSLGKRGSSTLTTQIQQQIGHQKGRETGILSRLGRKLEEIFWTTPLMDQFIRDRQIEEKQLPSLAWRVMPYGSSQIGSRKDLSSEGGPEKPINADLTRGFTVASYMMFDKAPEDLSKHESYILAAAVRRPPILGWRVSEKPGPDRISGAIFDYAGSQDRAKFNGEHSENFVELYKRHHRHTHGIYLKEAEDGRTEAGLPKVNTDRWQATLVRATECARKLDQPAIADQEETIMKMADAIPDKSEKLSDSLKTSLQERLKQFRDEFWRLKTNDPDALAKALVPSAVQQIQEEADTAFGALWSSRIAKISLAMPAETQARFEIEAKRRLQSWFLDRDKASRLRPSFRWWAHGCSEFEQDEIDHKFSLKQLLPGSIPDICLEPGRTSNIGAPKLAETKKPENPNNPKSSEIDKYDTPMITIAVANDQQKLVRFYSTLPAKYSGVDGNRASKGGRRAESYLRSPYYWGDENQQIASIGKVAAALILARSPSLDKKWLVHMGKSNSEKIAEDLRGLPGWPSRYANQLPKNLHWAELPDASMNKLETKLAKGIFGASPRTAHHLMATILQGLANPAKRNSPVYPPTMIGALDLLDFEGQEIQKNYPYRLPNYLALRPSRIDNPFYLLRRKWCNDEKKKYPQDECVPFKEAQTQLKIASISRDGRLLPSSLLSGPAQWDRLKNLLSAPMQTQPAGTLNKVGKNWNKRSSILFGKTGTYDISGQITEDAWKSIIRRDLGEQRILKLKGAELKGYVPAIWVAGGVRFSSGVNRGRGYSFVVLIGNANTGQPMFKPASSRDNGLEASSLAPIINWMLCDLYDPDRRACEGDTL